MQTHSSYRDAVLRNAYNSVLRRVKLFNEFIERFCSSGLIKEVF